MLHQVRISGSSGHDHAHQAGSPRDCRKQSVIVPSEPPLTVKQVASELGIANTRVMALVRQGRIEATRPGGPGTWRIERAKVDAYLARMKLETIELDQRRQAKLMKALIGVWDAAPDATKRQLEVDLPRDVFQPLARLMDRTRHQQTRDKDALVHAYRRRTEGGVEELALAMPHDRFWAVACLALAPM